MPLILFYFYVFSSSIFGEELNIHTGGDDLRFPHHENELAQSEACFQCAQWTNYWFHIGNEYLKLSVTLYVI